MIIYITRCFQCWRMWCSKSIQEKWIIQINLSQVINAKEIRCLGDPVLNWILLFMTLYYMKHILILAAQVCLMGKTIEKEDMWLLGKQLSLS